MRPQMIPLALMTGLALPVGAHAQPKPATGPGPKPESVLSHIPAGALGFVVVRDVRALAEKVDALLAEVGVAEMLKKVAPDGVLGALTAQLKLGYGFDADGGLAVVMLDPKAHGASLPRMMGLPDPGFKGPAGGPREQKPPFVLLVPGRGPGEVFGAYKTQDAGKYKRISFPGLPLLAAKLGGYVLLSPTAGALDAVLGADKKIAAALTKRQLAVIRGADAAVHVNMKIAHPTLDALIKRGQQRLTGGRGGIGFGGWLVFAGPISPAALWVMPQLAFYRYAFGEMDGLTLALRMTKTGLAFDVLAAWKPGSLFARAYADQKPPPAPLMALLPDRGHIFAIAAAPERGPHGVALDRKRVDAVVASPVTQSLSVKWRAQFKKLGYALADNVRRWELAFGGGGEREDGGVFSVVLILQGEDAERIKPLVAEAGRLFARWFLEKAADGDPDSAFKAEYVKGVETVEKLPIDALNFSHPELADMDDDDREKLKTLLGEEKIRFLVASPDKKTVIMTIGGSKGLMAEAIKAARAGASAITRGRAAAQSMRFMPKDASTLAVFNAGNAFEAVMNGAARMGASAEAPFSVSCRRPIAYGSAIAGRHKHGVLYVPSAVIKEVVGAYLSTVRAVARPAPPPEQPGPLDGEDF